MKCDGSYKIEFNRIFFFKVTILKQIINETMRHLMNFMRLKYPHNSQPDSEMECYSHPSIPFSLLSEAFLKEEQISGLSL